MKKHRNKSSSAKRVEVKVHHQEGGIAHHGASSRLSHAFGHVATFMGVKAIVETVGGSLEPLMHVAIEKLGELAEHAAPAAAEAAASTVHTIMCAINR